jgi:hypothetical protein
VISEALLMEKSTLSRFQQGSLSFIVAFARSNYCKQKLRSFWNSSWRMDQWVNRMASESNIHLNKWWEFEIDE